MEGLQGTNLTEANLTQWASYVQDVASGMRRPPRTAMECPKWDIAGVLHRLKNLTRVGFCHLCYTLGNTSMRGASPPMGPPPGFPAIGAPTPMDMSMGYNPLVHARVGRRTSASICTRLGQTMGAWCHRLAPAMTLSPPSTSYCLRRSRGTSHHPIPAGSTPTSAGEVFFSHHQGRSYN